jgi:thiol-disulfide isomerase/thioredoxin
MRVPFRWTAVLGLVAALAIAACADREATSQPTPSTAEPAAQADPKGSAEKNEDKPIRIAQGQPVEIRDYLVPGQITVFDFMSDYCGPCVRIAPFIDRLHAERSDITVVKVDINRPEIRGIDWRSPVARQYNMSSIPFFKIYGADGQLMAEGAEAGMMLDRWLQEMVGRGG